jgi:pSer/pThr/pTyr-binding forkhead associated (FHA) protein
VALSEDRGLGRGEFQVRAEVREGPGGGPIGALVLEDGSRVQLGDEPVTIGRSPDCDVVLRDGTVSKHHAEVRREGAGFLLVDLGSLNGTRVNGRGVKEHRLADGDQVAVGPVALRFEAS